MGGVDPDEVPRTRTFLLPELAQLPGHLLWRAAARVVWLLRDTLPPATDIHEYAALVALADGRPRSQQDLADAIAVSRTTLTRVAGGLVADGLVERTRNPRDRRSYALTRTEAGARRAADLTPDLLAAERAVAAAFTDEEADALRASLRLLLRDHLSADTPTQLDTSLGFLLTRLHFHLHRDVLERLAPLGVEPRHFGSVVALRALGPVSQVELVRALGVSGPTGVQIVDELEARGLVERRRSPADRRTHLLHLLPTADAVLAQGDVIQRACITAWLAVLDTDRAEQLWDLLRRFITQP